MIRKILILTAVLTAFAAGASAQSLSAFKERLAEPVAGDGAYQSITVTERGDAAEAVGRASHDNARLRFKGYRVCIFFDNGQNARFGAESARASFAAAYPDVQSYIAYNSPYFTVTVGDCVTVEEAIILMGKVKDAFPKAFLKNEELSVADLVK